MDIRQHAVSETSVLHLRDAGEELMNDENGQPVTVTLYGPGSKQYAAAQAAHSIRIVNRMKKKGKDDRSVEEMAQEKAAYLASCTHSMQNVDYDGLTGEALHKAVYADITIGFIADQVAKHLGDWANFTRGSQKT